VLPLLPRVLQGGRDGERLFDEAAKGILRKGEMGNMLSHQGKEKNKTRPTTAPIWQAVD